MMGRTMTVKQLIGKKIHSNYPLGVQLPLVELGREKQGYGIHHRYLWRLWQR